MSNEIPTPEQPQYKVGDVVNGHVLTESNEWKPVEPIASQSIKPARKWFTKKRYWIPAAVLMLIIINLANSKVDPKTDDAAATTSETTETKAAAQPKAAPVMVVVPDVTGQDYPAARDALTALGFTVTETPDPDATVNASTPAAGTSAEKGSAITLAVTVKPKLSLAQQNALKEAASYLDYSGFSRQGLIDQMTSEYGAGYPLDVATWAVDTLNPDWNAEAAESAKSYLDYSSFSRDGLFEQLTSAYGGQFTPDQANAGLAAVGY